MKLTEDLRFYIREIERYIKALDGSKGKFNDPERDKAIDDKLAVFRDALKQLQEAQAENIYDEIEQAIANAKDVIKNY
ncbi:hypothetical protein [Bdellovibrio sp. HCB288]|uniref:hypothetical protein n=1 Tax=Bdellovibrio sp. HCB288 TaxID=3394355 RepID=UPI0039B3EE2C